MKRFSRCLCLILVMAILLTMPVFGAEGTSVWSSKFFVCYTVTICEVTSYTFQAWFDVTAKGSMDVLGASVIKIQRSTDCENWTTTKTYTMEDYPQFVAEDSVAHMAYKTYTGTKGYYYRSVVTLYAKNSSGIGEYTAYSEPFLVGA